jgi:hypothetical protein
MKAAVIHSSFKVRWKMRPLVVSIRDTIWACVVCTWESLSDKNALVVEDRFLPVQEAR